MGAEYCTLNLPWPLIYINRVDFIHLCVRKADYLRRSWTSNPQGCGNLHWDWITYVTGVLKNAMDDWSMLSSSFNSKESSVFGVRYCEQYTVRRHGLQCHHADSIDRNPKVLYPWRDARLCSRRLPKEQKCDRSCAISPIRLTASCWYNYDRLKSNTLSRCEAPSRNISSNCKRTSNGSSAGRQGRPSSTLCEDTSMSRPLYEGNRNRRDSMD